VQIAGAAVCAAAIGAVVVAVALGTWWSAAPSARSDSAAVGPADQAPAASASGSAGAVATSTGATQRDAVTVYLTSSAEEADAIERSTLLRNREGAEGDASVLPLPAGTAEERARVRAVVRDLRLHLGDEKVRVVDLRASSERDGRMGGMAELYREQELARRAGTTS
jgi:hypothetical protein